MYLGNSNVKICDANSIAMTAMVEETEHGVQCESDSVEKWQYLTCENTADDDTCNEDTLAPTCGVFADMINDLLDILPTLPVPLV